MSYRWTNSGLLVPGTPAVQKRRLIAIDLFCGCGGMSLGLHQAGFHVVAAMDNDPHATTTYLVNLGEYPVQLHFATKEDKHRLNDTLERLGKDQPGNIAVPLVSGSNKRAILGDEPGCEHFWFGDIRQVTGQQILDVLGLKPEDVDLVAGGPPCQGFSRAGKQNVMDPRNSLVFEFARLVLEIRPKTFMMENVPGMLNMVTPEGVPVIDALCRVLEDGDFGAYDALKQSLLASSGAGAAMRSRGRSNPVNTGEASAQLGLFEEAVS